MEENKVVFREQNQNGVADWLLKNWAWLAGGIGTGLVGWQAVDSIWGKENSWFEDTFNVDIDPFGKEDADKTPKDEELPAEFNQEEYEKWIHISTLSDYSEDADPDNDHMTNKEEYMHRFNPGLPNTQEGEAYSPILETIVQEGESPDPANYEEALKLNRIILDHIYKIEDDSIRDDVKDTYQRLRFMDFDDVTSRDDDWVSPGSVTNQHLDPDDPAHSLISNIEEFENFIKLFPPELSLELVQAAAGNDILLDLIPESYFPYIAYKVLDPQKFVEILNNPGNFQTLDNRGTKPDDFDSYSLSTRVTFTEDSLQTIKTYLQDADNYLGSEGSSVAWHDSSEDVVLNDAYPGTYVWSNYYRVAYDILKPEIFEKLLYQTELNTPDDKWDEIGLWSNLENLLEDKNNWRPEALKIK